MKTKIIFTFLLTFTVCYSQNSIDSIRNTININSDYISVYPKVIDHYLDRGQAYDKINEFDSAIMDYSKVLELDTLNKWALFRRAFDYGLIEKFKEAKTDYNKIIRLNPNDYICYYFRGLTKTSLKQYDEAIEDFTTAIKLNPNDGYYYYRRALCWSALYDLNATKHDIDKAFILAPELKNDKGIMDFYDIIIKFLDKDNLKKEKLYRKG